MCESFSCAKHNTFSWKGCSTDCFRVSYLFGSTYQRFVKTETAGSAVFSKPAPHLLSDHIQQSDTCCGSSCLVVWLQHLLPAFIGIYYATRLSQLSCWLYLKL